MLPVSHSLLKAGAGGLVHMVIAETGVDRQAVEVVVNVELPMVHVVSQERHLDGEVQAI